MNMGRIVDKARAQDGSRKFYSRKSTPLGVDSGWLLNFLDKSKTVSDDEMQDLMGKHFSWRSQLCGVILTKDLDNRSRYGSKVAALFNTFCSLCIVSLEDSIRTSEVVI